MKTAAKKQAPPLSLDPRRRRAKIMNRLKNDWLLYLLLVPVLAWYLIFCYAPMGGLVLAFKDYSFKLGIWDSPWIGMGNFTKMFSDRYFLRGLKNTLVFGIGGILISMPCEIALALMLNELRLRGMKKFVQTTVTFPHFISWVVLAGILTNIFASTGAINQILRLFGMSAVKFDSAIDLVIEMETWEDGKLYDRLGADEHFTTLMDTRVPTLTIPVRPGRNLAVVIEVAAMNNRNKKMGCNDALELAMQVDSHIDQKYLELNPQ